MLLKFRGCEMGRLDCVGAEQEVKYNILKDLSALKDTRATSFRKQVVKKEGAGLDVFAASGPGHEDAADDRSGGSAASGEAVTR